MEQRKAAVRVYRLDPTGGSVRIERGAGVLGLESTSAARSGLLPGGSDARADRLMIQGRRRSRPARSALLGARLGAVDPVGETEDEPTPALPRYCSNSRLKTELYGRGLLKRTTRVAATIRPYSTCVNSLSGSGAAIVSNH